MVRFKFLGLAVFLLVSRPLFASDPVLIGIDTRSVEGFTGGFSLALDFIDADPASNTATITGFSTDGSLGLVFNIGDVSGDLSDTVILGDADFFNELRAEITFGTYLFFFIEVSDGVTAGFLPDSFSFFLLDPTLLPMFPTSDPTGADALLAIDVDGSSTGLISEFEATAPPPGAEEDVTWRVTTGTGPDCELDVTADYMDGNLELEFELGTTAPALWNAFVLLQGNLFRLWTIPRNPTPTEIIPLTINDFPEIGVFEFITSFRSANGRICSDKETVDTGAGPLLSGAELEALLGPRDAP